MDRRETVLKLKQMVGKIDEFYAELKSKFPNCENNLEKQSFISYSQFIKADYLRKIEQYSHLSDEEFAKMPTIDFQMRTAETSFKSIELHFKTMMKSENNEYRPSDPSKLFPPI